MPVRYDDGSSTNDPEPIIEITRSQLFSLKLKFFFFGSVFSILFVLFGAHIGGS